MEHPFFINNGPPNNRSEALRWLSIAEKLLTNRDLVGCKSFASRARESDPTLVHPTDQILGIVDTLTSGDKRINNNYFDYYSILQVPPNQAQNTEFIADQYRRLALLLNPQNNSFPYSDQAFRLVVDAFSVLSNPMRKSMYDKELGFFINLHPVVSAPTSVDYVHHCGYSNSNADQLFVNMPSQDQGSHGMNFSRDPPQAEMSMAVTFVSRDQETMTMTSSGIEQQQPSFLRQQTQQPVNPALFSNADVQRATFLQTQPLSSVSFANTDEQPATFLNLNQPQPVTSVRSSNRENPSFGTGSISPPVQERVVSAEQQRSEQPPEVNENVEVGNNENQPAGTSNNVSNSFSFSKSNTNSSNTMEKEGRTDVSEKRIPSFWTACPYCYIMYEYPLDYTDCTLRCQFCKRAFQAVTVASPPPTVNGKEAYFCCWGFMPFGFSVETFERRRNDASSWSPFSPLFTCPGAAGDGGMNVSNHGGAGQSIVNNNPGGHIAGGSRGGGGGQNQSAARIYVDDEDDVYVEISEQEEESDEDWNGEKGRKKSNNGKWKSAIENFQETAS